MRKWEFFGHYINWHQRSILIGNWLYATQFENQYGRHSCISHDDVIKWKHFPRYWPLVREIHRSLVNSPHKGQWRWALIFSLIFAWTNSWANNGNAGDLTPSRKLWRHCNGVLTIVLSTVATGHACAHCDCSLCLSFWTSLQRRHNERDGFSNYRRLDCLLNRLFKCRQKKTSKLRVTGLSVTGDRWIPRTFSGWCPAFM